MADMTGQWQIEKMPELALSSGLHAKLTGGFDGITNMIDFSYGL
jgi:hypothetical protein